MLSVLRVMPDVFVVPDDVRRHGHTHCLVRSLKEAHDTYIITLSLWMETEAPGRVASSRSRSGEWTQAMMDFPSPSRAASCALCRLTRELGRIFPGSLLAPTGVRLRS